MWSICSQAHVEHFISSSCGAFHHKHMWSILSPAHVEHFISSTCGAFYLKRMWIICSQAHVEHLFSSTCGAFYLKQIWLKLLCRKNNWPHYSQLNYSFKLIFVKNLGLNEKKNINMIL